MSPHGFDMAEQLRHVFNVMLAILQPALWLILCIGFVLASAHLLTMLGTRWGDRRVSPKALFFSVAIHLSLGVAVVAMIPEYRQHILSLGQEDPPPVSVELLATTDPNEPPATSEGNVPVWEQLPQQIQVTPTRTEVEQPPNEELPNPDRPATIQLAAARPVESPMLPTAPEVFPEPTPAATPSPPQSPAEASLAVNVPVAEARQEAARPRLPTERTSPPVEQERSPEETGRPPAIEAVEDRPAARSIEGPLASLSTPSRMETPELQRTPLSRPTPDVQPAPQSLPLIQPAPDSRPSPPNAGTPSAEPRGPQRMRSQAVARAQDAPVERYRPGLIPLTPEPAPRERERRPLPRRDDAALPDLYRPELDPSRAAAAIGTGRVPASYRLRTDQDRKDDAIRKYGGNEDTQKAVERALRWLASLQEADGRWDADKYGGGNGPPESDRRIAQRQYAGRNSDTGISALVLLALLGNGNSLSEGPYSVQVERAVAWLISQQADDGSLAGDATVFEAMYCHGMATLALAEAYAMETDALTRSALRAPLERALAYSATQQLEDGGWRYLARQEGGGDMSMFGWQLMAFRSAQDGGIPIPANVRSKMISFLNTRSRGKQRGLASYRMSDPVTAAMTAEALFCKQMLGLKRDNPMAVEATDYLLRSRPKLSELNLYYWYYGTLAMFQHGGKEWTQWNDAIRDLLVSEQVATGPFAGSWAPRDLYSRYGGRLFSTATATLCLEVYYRRLPMYQRTDPLQIE